MVNCATEVSSSGVFFLLLFFEFIAFIRVAYAETFHSQALTCT